jgi:hypothetical protein
MKAKWVSFRLNSNLNPPIIKNTKPEIAMAILLPSGSSPLFSRRAKLNLGNSQFNRLIDVDGEIRSLESVYI